MAINPLIALQGQPIDVGGAVQNGLQAYQSAQLMGMRQDEAKMRQPLLEAQTEAARQQVTSGKQAQFDSRQKSVIQGSFIVKQLLDAGDVQGAAGYLQQRRNDLAKYGVDTSDTDNGLALLQQDPTGQQLKSVVDANVALGLQAGLLGGGLDSKTRGFRAMTAGMSQEDIEKARRIELGLDPRAMGSAGITIAQQGLTIPVAQSQAVIKGAESGASRQAESNVDLSMKPQIESATTAAKTTAEESAKREAGIIKAIGEEKEVGRILDLAEPLLKDATQSLAGTTMDAAGRLVGLSSKGAEAAAQLKTLEGALIMKMPRMEGPQSNADQLLYRQMAAQVGDATIPAAQRKAAMDMLRSLNKRYSGASGAPPADSASPSTRPPLSSFGRK